ncbi:MAG: hypothetical protein ACLSTV_01205 [Coriobacteriales bacterium]
MKPFQTDAYIHSLNLGKLHSDIKAEITVLAKLGDNDYKVDYKGVKCHALFNPFVCTYFADDVYGIIEED